MIIECINCKVKYNIDTTKIEPPGKKVKCSKCGELFFVDIKPELDENTSQVVSSSEAENKASAKIDNDLRTTASENLDETEVEKDAKTEKTENEQIEDISPSIDLTPEPKAPESELNEKSESDETDLKADESENVEVSETVYESEPSLELDDDVSSSDEPTLETTFEEAVGEESLEETEADFEEENNENVEPDEENVTDWESLEVDEIEENMDVGNRKTLTDSDAEIPEGDLEVENSREKIKKEKKKREEQNPFRTPSLAPDLSDTYSSYNRVSDSVQKNDSNMQVDSINDGGQKVYKPTSSVSKKKKSFLSSFFTNLAILVVMVVLFTALLFSLITFGIIPKDQYNKYLSYVSKYLPAIQDEDIKRLGQLSVRDLSGKWVNTRNGFLFIVYGEVINNSNKPVNYIKLRSEFSSAGDNLYTQEFYSGNTLTMRELKNSSVSTLEKKLNRKSGDVDFDDVDSFAGRNFNIEPGKSVPFYTFYLSKRKILGLKYDIEVLDFESTGI